MRNWPLIVVGIAIVFMQIVIADALWTIATELRTWRITRFIEK